MKNKAVFQVGENARSGRLAAALLLIATTILLTGLVGTAAAGPIGKDGRIYACYKVKGKPRGAMRVLFKGKRCKRGERRVAWVAAGSSTVQQGTGTDGQDGQSGATGTPGATGSLSTQVGTLALKVDGLEETLQGVKSGDLDGALTTLKGLTNEELTEAVEVVPDVEGLCKEAEALAKQVNLLQGVIGGLGLSSALEAIGALKIPPPPPALKLEEFGCPAP